MADRGMETSAQTASVREQLAIALEILDNPGGGLVFGYQALGQARSRLAELDADRFQAVIQQLDEAERQAIWRNFGRAQEIISEALIGLAAA
jgi:hypothetical protein